LRGRLTNAQRGNAHALLRYATSPELCHRLPGLRPSPEFYRITTYAYDALSRKISVSNPDFTSPLVQMSYTPDGLLASLTNANGYATTFTPDGFDRLSKNVLIEG